MPVEFRSHQRPTPHQVGGVLARTLRLLEHLIGKLVRIAFFKVDSDNISINDHLGANDTWPRGAIEVGTLNWYAVAGRLDNNILFGVQTAAEFVSLT